MIVQLNTSSIINMKRLMNVGIGVTTKTDYEDAKLFGLFPIEKKVTLEEFQLKVQYVCAVTDKELTMSWTCSDRVPLEAMIKAMIEQLKNSDSVIIDKAFEDVFLK